MISGSFFFLFKRSTGIIQIRCIQFWKWQRNITPATFTEKPSTHLHRYEQPPPFATDLNHFIKLMCNNSKIALFLYNIECFCSNGFCLRLIYERGNNTLKAISGVENPFRQIYHTPLAMLWMTRLSFL